MESRKWHAARLRKVLSQSSAPGLAGSRESREGAEPIGVCLLCGRVIAGPLKDLQEHLEKQNVQYMEI